MDSSSVYQRPQPEDTERIHAPKSESPWCIAPQFGGRSAFQSYGILPRFGPSIDDRAGFVGRP